MHDAVFGYNEDEELTTKAPRHEEFRSPFNSSLRACILVLWPVGVNEEGDRKDRLYRTAPIRVYITCRQGT